MLLSLLFQAAAASAVVIIPGGADPKTYSGDPAITSEDAYFRGSAPMEFFNNTANLIMTSLSATDMSSTPGLHPSGDSFIRGAIQAWGEHLHLVVRPDEVWFTILVQLNFYMLSHAEEIRDLFVSHTGQEEIFIKDFTWDAILLRFGEAIQARVKTPWLLDWLTPNFTTTTPSDRMTANILMMGLTKAYFKYIGKQVCGLPSVTLLGSAADWEALLAKLDRLPAFGPEPEAYAARLRPILTRFVASFREPDTPETRRFWNQVVSARAEHVCGRPPVYVSGWITGFYYWNDNGRAFARVEGTQGLASESMLTLDGVRYPVLDMTSAPVGYARAPFVMRDYEGVEDFPAYVAAGTLGKQITVGPPAGYREALLRAGGNVSLAEEGNRSLHGTLKPLSGWMLYGPLDHNATQSRWTLVEDELNGILASAGKYMTEETCGLVDGP
ncbi:hypothetical protein C8A03DRAFT_13699 [Achaetomium macrosporum]|uniref:Uncharacterized protein n=1 Tax=Achaetomium macrosporum TaxID=79813 RepID=A0AAN7CDW1_9PEZI|nr:hypothetical protein C8A03DRAFT_13699 [Achaetomium macrosporum]